MNASFEADDARRRTARSDGTFAGIATFDGCVVVTTPARDEVAALLPADLELADSPAPHRHPILFVLGRQRSGVSLVAGLRFPFPVVYGEFALAVPFVRHRRGARLHTYVPRMVSSYFPATWTGNEYYGLGKRMGDVRRDRDLVLLCDEQDRLLLHAVVAARGEWLTGAGDPPLLALVRSAFALPIVGRKTSGTWIGCRFDWDFGGAEVRAIDAALEIDRPFVPGLEAGSQDGVGSDSFEVRAMAWRLSWPSAFRP
jgi:hypothetical protein